MSGMVWTDIIVVVAAYLLGCLQTGYYLVRALTGQDLRRIGSGSTGARNVERVLGRKGFAITMLGDVGKGALAVAVAGWMLGSPWAVGAAVVAVAVGHVWPVQLGFSGGRGVAVGMGALVVYEPSLLGVLLVATPLMSLVIRNFHASGLMGFVVVPLAAWYYRLPCETLASVGCLSAIVLFAHRSHIVRWLQPAPKQHSEGETKAGGPENESYAIQDR